MITHPSDAPLSPSLLLGCLKGIAAGDSLGLPYEGLSPGRAARLLGPPDRHRLFFGYGTPSDDLDHALFTATALIRSSREGLFSGDHFSMELRRALKWWIAGLPCGIGLATLRSGIKAWTGVSPRNTGVFSAGNGPAMRAPVIGVWHALHPETDLADMVIRSTRLTHTDPMALIGAWIIARAAAMAASGFYPDADRSPDDTADDLLSPPADIFTAGENTSDDPLFSAARSALIHALQGGDTGAFIEKTFGNKIRKKGVSGYILHTVPVVLHLWIRYFGNYEATVQNAIGLGGDADTVAAIAGGLAGITAGPDGIPDRWWKPLVLFPLSRNALEETAECSVNPARPGAIHSDAPSCRLLPPLFPRLLRNFFMTLVVLFHGFRRLFPPW